MCHLLGGERLMQESLEEVLGLAEGFDVYSAELLVPSGEITKLLLEVQRGRWTANAHKLFFRDARHRAGTAASQALNGFSE